MYLRDKYVNPLTDFGFKKLFGEEPNKELLIDFLNQLLPEAHKIEELTYSKNEHLGQKALDRRAIFDLHCKNAKGDWFIVELQKAKQNYFKDRSVYYSTFPIQEQARRGDWDFQLAAVYTIGVLDFIFDESKEEPAILHKVQLKNERNQVFYDKLTYIYIELPKFLKKEHQLTNRFDKWLYILRHLAQLNERPKRLKEDIFTRLFEAAEIAQFSQAERVRYEDSLKYYRDIKNVVDTSKQEGWIEGKQEGIKEGMQKGKQEGIKQGLLRTALEMKNDGLSISKIALYTGLSIDEIELL